MHYSERVVNEGAQSITIKKTLDDIWDDRTKLAILAMVDVPRSAKFRVLYKVPSRSTIIFGNSNRSAFSIQYASACDRRPDGRPDRQINCGPYASITSRSKDETAFVLTKFSFTPAPVGEYCYERVCLSIC